MEHNVNTTGFDNDEHLRSSCNITTFEQVILEPIVDKILSFLDTAEDQCNCRLINSMFNFIAKFKVHFAPILTDITSKAFLAADPHLLVTKIKVKDLYTSLETTDQGILSHCNFDRLKVTSLEFYEGVTATNKNILLSSFPRLTDLSYLGSTNFTCPRSQDLLFLKKFQIYTDTCNDDGNSLSHFLTTAKFPTLEQVDIHLYVRRDFLLYFAVHLFIANHHTSIRRVDLKFSAKGDYKPPESLSSGVVVSYTIPLVKQFHQLVQTLDLVRLDHLSIHFLPFEGTSLFQLSFALVESQESLKTLRLHKEFTCSRTELLPLTSIIMRNEKSLTHLDIPHPYNFDCAVLQNCRSLQAFSIGKLEGNYYPMMFSDSDIFQVNKLLPLINNLQKFKISIRLSRRQVEWIVENLMHMTEFYFNGYQTDYYTCDHICNMMSRFQKLHYFGFNCDMTKDEFQLLREKQRDRIKYCNNGEEEFCHRATFEITLSPKTK